MRPYTRYLLAVAMISLFLSACLPFISSRVVQSNLSRDQRPNVTQDDQSVLVAGNNAFAFDLYQSIKTTDGNVFLSPYSISLAMAMTFAGARGETAAQMAAALHFTLPQERLHPAIDQLDLSLIREGQHGSNKGQPLQMDIANSVWADKTLTFMQQYLDLIAKNYGAGINLADFINQPEVARGEIDQWVSDQTKQKIKDLIPEGAVDNTTRLVLVNAVYFKAEWENQFDPTETKAASFHLLDGSVSQDQMMSNVLTDVPYLNGDGYQAVELNYLGDTAAMDIFVPDEGKFSDFESQFNSQKLEDILTGLQPAALSLGLPKFSYKTSFDLSKQLTALGIKDAFDPNLADFSGMTGGRDLVINKALHQAFVNVDENGTEAAAATSVIMMPTSIMLPQGSLTIDRPFIFIIRDIASKQILFIGRVLDPTK